MTLQARRTIYRQVWAAGAPDAHNNPVDAWSDPIPMLVFGWGPPSADTENTAGRSEVIRDLDVYAPVGTVVAPKDLILVGGITYEVLGWPEDFTNGPFAFEPGVRINLNRSEG